MSTIISFLIYLLLFGAIFWKAHQYGNGRLWLGLKRYFDSDYIPDKEQNEIIEEGLLLLAQRLDAYAPRGWTIEFQQGQPDRPPLVRLVITGTSYDGAYLYDSPAELLQKWSLPAQKEE